MIDTLASRGGNIETQKTPIKNNSLPNSNLLQGGNADAFKKFVNPATIVVFVIVYLVAWRLFK